MATQVKHRRGTASEHDAFTGGVGELTYVTDNKSVRIHDGFTVGGIDLLKDRGVVATYETLADLVVETNEDIIYEGAIVKTRNHSASGDLGGAEYIIVSDATYAAGGNASVTFPDGSTRDTTVPDGEIVSNRRIGMDHAIGATGFVAKYNETVGFDRACGVVGGSIDQHDDLPALQKLIDWGRIGSPQDDGFIQKGYRDILFHPRSVYYTNGSIDLRSSRYDYDFQQSLIIPMTATVPALLWDSIFSSLFNVNIDGLNLLTRQDWMASQEPLIEWGMDEPASYSNGSQATFERVRAVGGYNTFQLNSVGATDASFIWGSNFKNCYLQDAVNYVYYFNSPYETSTTMTYDACHARCITRDSVSVGGFDYFCIRHHVSALSNKPGSGVDWETYWIKKDATVTSRGEWSSNNQYLTGAKGFYFNNVNTLSMLGCSQDGGTNTENGSAVYYNGQFIYIDRFHLESFNHEEVNDTRPFYFLGDFKFEVLALFTHRFSLPDGENAYFIGGDPDVVDNNKRGTLLGAVNKIPVYFNAVDNPPIWMDCAGWLSLELGTGIPLNGVANVRGTTIAHRGINNTIVKPLSGGTTISFTPDESENGVHFIAGDGAGDIDLTINLDNYLFVETADAELDPTYSTFSFKVTLLEGAALDGGITFVGLNGAAIVPHASYGAGTYRVTKVSATRWYVEDLTNKALTTVVYKTSGTLEYNKINSLQGSGTFTLPAADSVPKNSFILVEKSETSKADTPTVERSGTDDLRTSAGVGTSTQLSTAEPTTLRFVSNGVDEWRI